MVEQHHRALHLHIHRSVQAGSAVTKMATFMYDFRGDLQPYWEWCLGRTHLFSSGVKSSGIMGMYTMAVDLRFCLIHPVTEVTCGALVCIILTYVLVVIYCVCVWLMGGDALPPLLLLPFNSIF